MKNNYIRNSAKVLFNYVMALIVFLVFLYVFLSIAKDNFSKYLPLYSILLFLLMFLIIYSDMKSLAVKEKRPQNEMNPYPLKGLAYGLIGTAPIALIIGAASVISFGDQSLDRIKHVVINCLLGPMYFLIRWLSESPAGYAAGILLLPLIAMLGYLAGYYRIDIMSRFRKKKAIAEKGFTKSPWNPSNVPEKKTTKKKSSTKKTSGGN
jgi:hypothetical protein